MYLQVLNVAGEAVDVSASTAAQRPAPQHSQAPSPAKAFDDHPRRHRGNARSISRIGGWTHQQLTLPARARFGVASASDRRPDRVARDPAIGDLLGRHPAPRTTRPADLGPVPHRQDPSPPSARTNQALGSKGSIFGRRLGVKSACLGSIPEDPDGTVPASKRQITYAVSLTVTEHGTLTRRESLPSTSPGSCGRSGNVKCRGRRARESP